MRLSVLSDLGARLGEWAWDQTETSLAQEGPIPIEGASHIERRALSLDFVDLNQVMTVTSIQENGLLGKVYAVAVFRFLSDPGEVTPLCRAEVDAIA